MSSKCYTKMKVLKEKGMDFEHLSIDLIEWKFIYNLLVDLMEHNNSYGKFQIKVNNNTFKNYRKTK